MPYLATRESRMICLLPMHVLNLYMNIPHLGLTYSPHPLKEHLIFLWMDPVPALMTTLIMQDMLWFNSLMLYWNQILYLFNQPKQLN